MQLVLQFCIVDNSSIGAAVGIVYQPVTFVVSFLGMLMASVLCYILSRSNKSNRNQVHMSILAKVYEVGINKKNIMELDTNTTYELVSAIGHCSGIEQAQLCDFVTDLLSCHLKI